MAKIQSLPQPSRLQGSSDVSNVGVPRVTPDDFGAGAWNDLYNMAMSGVRLNNTAMNIFIEQDHKRQDAEATEYINGKRQTWNAKHSELMARQGKSAIESEKEFNDWVQADIANDDYNKTDGWYGLRVKKELDDSLVGMRMQLRRHAAQQEVRWAVSEEDKAVSNANERVMRNPGSADLEYTSVILPALERKARWLGLGEEEKRNDRINALVSLRINQYQGLVAMAGPDEAQKLLDSAEMKGLRDELGDKRFAELFAPLYQNNRAMRSTAELQSMNDDVIDTFDRNTKLGMLPSASAEATFREVYKRHPGVDPAKVWSAITSRSSSFEGMVKEARERDEGWCRQAGVIGALTGITDPAAVLRASGVATTAENIEWVSKGLAVGLESRKTGASLRDKNVEEKSQQWLFNGTNGELLEAKEYVQLLNLCDEAVKLPAAEGGLSLEESYAVRELIAGRAEADGDELFQVFLRPHAQQLSAMDQLKKAQEADTNAQLNAVEKDAAEYIASGSATSFEAYLAQNGKSYSASALAHGRKIANEQREQVTKEKTGMQYSNFLNYRSKSRPELQSLMANVNNRSRIRSEVGDEYYNRLLSYAETGSDKPAEAVLTVQARLKAEMDKQRALNPTVSNMDWDAIVGDALANFEDAYTIESADATKPVSAARRNVLIGEAARLAVQEYRKGLGEPKDVTALLTPTQQSRLIDVSVPTSQTFGSGLVDVEIPGLTEQQAASLDEMRANGMPEDIIQRTRDDYLQTNYREISSRAMTGGTATITGTGGLRQEPIFVDNVPFLPYVPINAFGVPDYAKAVAEEYPEASYFNINLDTGKYYLCDINGGILSVVDEYTGGI